MYSIYYIESRIKKQPELQSVTFVAILQNAKHNGFLNDQFGKSDLKPLKNISRKYHACIIVYMILSIICYTIKEF